MLGHKLDRPTSEEVRRRIRVREKMSDRVDRKVWKCFGHVERMSGKRLIKREYESQLEGTSDRGSRPLRGG